MGQEGGGDEAQQEVSPPVTLRPLPLPRSVIKSLDTLYGMDRYDAFKIKLGISPSYSLRRNTFTCSSDISWSSYAMGQRQRSVLPHWRRRLMVVFPIRFKHRRRDWQSIRADAIWRSDINWVIMDYLVSEGYPAAAEKFAQETNLPGPVDHESICERVRVRTAIHSGNVKEAIQMVNEIDPEVSRPTSLSSAYMMNS